MDRNFPAGTSTRPPLMGWWRRLLISLLLVVAYAFCYFVVPKIYVSWRSPGPRGCDLRLMPSVQDVAGIPKVGDSLIIVAVVDHVLHFRIFDGNRKMVVDTDEKKLTVQARRIEVLRTELKSLWPPQEPTGDERVWVNTSVTSIVGYTWLQPPGWVLVLDGCSRSFAWFAPRILLVWMCFRLLRRWYSSIKSRPRPASVRPGDRSRDGRRFRSDHRLAQRLAPRPLSGGAARRGRPEAARRQGRHGGPCATVAQAPRGQRHLQHGSGHVPST